MQTVRAAPDNYGRWLLIGIVEALQLANGVHIRFGSPPIADNIQIFKGAQVGMRSPFSNV